MPDVVRLGGRVPALELTIRRRSQQSFALEVSTDAGPLVVTGAVVLQVEDPTSTDGTPLEFVGAVDGSVVTWTLSAADSDLPFGQRWASLSVLASDGTLTVWARGSAWVR